MRKAIQQAPLIFTLLVTYLEDETGLIQINQRQSRIRYVGLRTKMRVEEKISTRRDLGICSAFLRWNALLKRPLIKVVSISFKVNSNPSLFVLMNARWNLLYLPFPFPSKVENPKKAILTNGRIIYPLLLMGRCCDK